jgi:indole-3-glycerol phosphate synthase
MYRNARGILEPIVEAKRLEVESLRPGALELKRAAEEATPVRAFETVLRGPEVRLIAEFKRRSPSAGSLRENAAITNVVTAYEAAGAVALSVLTDHEFFGGSFNDLQEARKVTRLPVLRKDFIIDVLQVFQTRAIGADAVLLIVRLLEAEQLRDLLETARGLSLGVLVETHDVQEVEEALRAGATVIGVNNRDLSNFRTDPETVLRMVQQIPPEIIVVGESGIRSSADVDRMGAAGVDAVLVGETLMRASDPGAVAAALTRSPRATRSALART